MRRDESARPEILAKGLAPRLVLTAVVLIAGCVLCLKFFSGIESFSFLARVEWTGGRNVLAMLGLGALAFLQLVTAALLPAVVFAKLLRRERLWSLICVTAISSALNALLPAKGGTLAKAFLFRRAFGIGYTQFAVSHFWASLVSVTLSALVLAWVAGDRIAIWLASSPTSQGVLLVSTALMAVVAAVWLVLRRHAGQTALKRSLGQVFAPGASNPAPTVAAAMSGLAVLQILVLGARAMLAAAIVGGEPSWGGVLTLGAALTMAPLVAVLPGGLGVREAAFVAAGYLGGVAPPVALSAALLDRMIGTLVVSVFGLASLRVLGLRNEE